MADKNLLRRLLPGIFKQASEIQNPFTTLFQSQLNPFFGVTAQQQFLKAYKGWVYACVTAIANEVAEMQLILKKESPEGDVKVEQHELIDLLSKVNPRMTQYELFEITQSHLELEGNAFWWLGRDAAGKIKEIWPLRPDRVTFLQSKENPLAIAQYIYRQQDGGKTFFEPDDIIHFANFNAEGNYPFPTRGKGTVEAAALAIDTNDFARQWNANFFKNSARPDMIFKSSGTLGADEYEQLKRKINSAFQGVSKSHKMILLQGGLEMEKINNTQKDMDFVKQVTQTRDEILAVFRVPKTSIGLGEDVNRATAEAQNFVFTDRTIKPKMKRMVDTLNEFLIPRIAGEDSGLFFDFVSPVPEDREKTIHEYTEGHNKWLTTNDIRRREGMSESTEGDSFFGPFNVVPIDNVPPEKKEAESEAHKEKREDREDKHADKDLTPDEKLKAKTRREIGKIFKKKNETKKNSDAELEPTPEPPKQLSEKQIKTYGEIWMKGIDEREKRIEPILEKYFNDQEKEVLDTLKDELKGLETKEYSLKQAELLPDKDEQIQALISLMTPEYQDMIKEAGDNAMLLTGADQVFDADSQAAQDFIEERASFFSEKINDTTFDALQNELAEGLRAGETLEELSERVAKVFDQARDFRTLRIARTEASAASNFAAQEGYKQAGVPQKQWVNFSPLDDTDDACGPVPDTVGIDAEFSNQLQAPPVHPNCVCTVIPIF